jgi:hypothetical protein
MYLIIIFHLKHNVQAILQVGEYGFTHASQIWTCHVEHPTIITCKGRNEFGDYNNPHLLGFMIPCFQHLHCVCQNCHLELVQTNIVNIQHLVGNPFIYNHSLCNYVQLNVAYDYKWLLMWQLFKFGWILVFLSTRLQLWPISSFQ